MTSTPLNHAVHLAMAAATRAWLVSHANRAHYDKGRRETLPADYLDSLAHELRSGLPGATYHWIHRPFWQSPPPTGADVAEMTRLASRPDYLGKHGLTACRFLLVGDAVCAIVAYADAASSLAAPQGLANLIAETAEAIRVHATTGRAFVVPLPPELRSSDLQAEIDRASERYIVWTVYSVDAMLVFEPRDSSLPLILARPPPPASSGAQ